MSVACLLASILHEVGSPHTGAPGSQHLTCDRVMFFYVDICFSCTVALVEASTLPCTPCCSSQYGDMLHDTERVSPRLQGRGGAVCWGAWHTGHVLPVHWMCGYRAVEHR